MFGIEEILIESNAVSINKNNTRANKIFYCSKFLQCRLIFLPKKSPQFNILMNSKTVVDVIWTNALLRNLHWCKLWQGFEAR